MRDVLSRMGRHGLAFAIGLMLTRLVGFVLQPFLTRAPSLGEQDYGVADNLAAAANLLMLVAAQALPSGLFRAYAYSAKDDGEKRTAIATAFRYTLVSSTGTALLFGALAVPMSRLVTGDGSYWTLFVLVLLTYLFANLKNVAYQILRADYRSGQFLAVCCTEFLLCAGLNIWFVVFLGLGAAGLIYSNLIGAAVGLTLAVRFVPQTIVNEYDADRKREMLRFGLPLMPQAVLLFLLNWSDRFLFVFLGGEDGVEMSGLYGRGQSFATILDGVLLMPFMMLWPSVYYEIGKRTSAAIDLGRCATYYVTVAAFLAVGLSAVSEPLVKAMLDARYHDAHVVVPVLAFAYLMFGLSDVTKVGMMLAGKTKRMPLLVFVAAVVSASTNVVLIPKLGILGAAWASFGAFATLAVLAFVVSQRLFHVTYEWVRLIRVGAIASLLLFANRYWTLGTDLTKLELLIDIARRGAAVTLAFPLLLLLTGGVTTRERAVLFGWLRKS